VKKLNQKNTQYARLEANTQKLNLKPTPARACVYHCVQLSYISQHRTVPIVCPLIVQTIIIAQMMFTRWEGVWNKKTEGKWSTQVHVEKRH